MDNDTPTICVPPKDLEVLAERMRGVTGFVSVLTTPPDSRTCVFSRYFHVRRVSWLARRLSELQVSGIHDIDELDWYSWAHDLNRWPFAHNSERGLFNQAADIPRYLVEEGVAAHSTNIRQLQAFLDRDVSTLNPVTSTVYLADVVTGFLEDPIWLLGALNVSPKIIPAEVAQYLCLPLGDSAFLDQIFHLYKCLRPGLDYFSYVAMFDSIFSKLALHFIHARLTHDTVLDSKLLLASSDFEEKRLWIKERFMRTVIFPYNNDKISRGACIRNELIIPLLPRLGKQLPQFMTRATDESLLAFAIECSILKQECREQLMPDLDYMEREEPENTLTAFLREVP